MADKVVRGRLEARDWALSRDLAFSLSALLSCENFGIGSFCASQQVAVECQVKLRVPSSSFLINSFFIPPAWGCWGTEDRSLSLWTFMSLDLSTSICTDCAFCMSIRRRVALLTPVPFDIKASVWSWQGGTVALSAIKKSCCLRCYHWACFAFLDSCIIYSAVPCFLWFPLIFPLQLARPTAPWETN